MSVTLTGTMGLFWGKKKIYQIHIRATIPNHKYSHFRKYPEGWTTDANRDTTLEYRLSIYHASHDDSGLFSCITPTRHTHSVEIVVKGKL